MMGFTLYSRSYCHLCDDMLAQLQAHQHDHLFTIEIRDVDADDSLLAVYDELVPVLIGHKEGQDDQQICHYFLDEIKLKAFFHA